MGSGATDLAILFYLESGERDGDPKASFDAEHADEALVEDDDPLRRGREERRGVMEGNDRARVDGRGWKRRKQVRWGK